MSTESILAERSGNACELCKGTENLAVYPVEPECDGSPERTAYVCEICRNQIEGIPDPDHWHGLSTAMWSPERPVQVLSWRMLQRLRGDHVWAQELFKSLYLDDLTTAWARASH